MPTLQIHSYRIFFSSNTFNPRLWLYGAENKIIGQLVFHPEGSVLPADIARSNGTYDLMYHLSEYPMLLDMLRNEKPVYLLFNGAGPGWENAVTTANEPTGEGEGV